MMNANGHGTDPWGPYRPAVEDQMAACADYLGRLQRSLAGEIAPDRHYFNDKAYQLQELARALVRRGQDIERWLNVCNASVPRAEEGSSGLAACERAAGHTGPHDDDPPPTLAERLCDEARALTDLTEQASHRVGWLAPIIDERNAARDPLGPEHREALHHVASTLDRIGYDARRLASRPHLPHIGRSAANPGFGFWLCYGVRIIVNTSAHSGRPAGSARRPWPA
jgi:hypothetical protein